MTSFYHGSDRYKLKTKEWQEGCDVFERMQVEAGVFVLCNGGPANAANVVDVRDYATIVTMEHAVTKYEVMCPALPEPEPSWR